MIEKTLNWYGVKLLYVIKVLGTPNPHLINSHYIEDYIAYEESVVVILADSFDAAFDKAEKLAKENEDEYQNYYGQTVQTRFHDSIDCYLIGEDEEVQLEDGVEVYSNLVEAKSTQDQEALLKQLFPIIDRPKYMLLNREFAQPKSDNGS